MLLYYHSEQGEESKALFDFIGDTEIKVDSSLRSE